MKIRIKGNFIRYRLTQSEVKSLANGATLSESTCFGPGEEFTFVYALQAKEGIEALQASFDGRKMTLFLPAESAKTWHAEDRVGFENEQEVSPGVFLKMLLEKDFACLDDTHEDQADKYPNPNAACQPGAPISGDN
ncbi:MAG: DUF7009 family protein [Saprospiraceae bacterium]